MAAATAVVGGTLWRFDAPLELSREPVRCGGINTMKALEGAWGAISDYGIADDVVATGDPIGLYVVDYSGRGVGLLDVHRPGVLQPSKSLQLIDPSTEFAKSPERIEAVRKIQNYLRTTHQVLESDFSNLRAIQVAAWAALGELSVPDDLAESVASNPAWTNAIQRYLDEISAQPAINSFPAPHRMDASIAAHQWPGWISLDVILSDIDGTRCSDQPIRCFTVGSSGSGRTDDSGKAVVSVRNPATGRPQDVRVSWDGVLPAGSFLKVVYETEDEERAQGYVMTAHAVPSNLEMLLSVPSGAC